MPVTKTTRECYEIREGHEWANITLHCWENPPHAGRTYTNYCGEIVISSSFGSWSNVWGACATPFKVFLTDISFDYAFGKFMGAALDCFDGEANVREIRKDICESRRQRNLTDDEARDLWDEVDRHEGDLEANEHSYGQAMWDIASSLGRNHEFKEYFADPCAWPRNTRYDYQAKGFWDRLWPIFVEFLKAEVAQPAPTTSTACPYSEWKPGKEFV